MSVVKLQLGRMGKGASRRWPACAGAPGVVPIGIASFLAWL
jgi:hypothetical protein